MPRSTNTTLRQFLFSLTPTIFHGLAPAAAGRGEREREGAGEGRGGGAGSGTKQAGNLATRCGRTVRKHRKVRIRARGATRTRASARGFPSDRSIGRSSDRSIGGNHGGPAYNWIMMTAIMGTAEFTTLG